MRRIIAPFILLAALTACDAKKGGDPYALGLTQVAYSEVPGWAEDHHARAFALFSETCGVNARRGNRFTTKTGLQHADGAAWERACNAARHLTAPTDEEARQYFESHFTPHRAVTGASQTGLTTGYYEPLLHGSKTRSARFNVPVYGTPYHFRKPSFSRAQIERGALNGKAPVLLYVDDAVMLFFLHIQGSGKVRMDDGSMMGLQYAAQNGHGYVPIGRVLKERGYLETVTMQTIRDWLRANPDKAQEIMDTNPSYIFFRLIPGGAYAKGALGISLTPGRSIAVDDDRVPYGSLVFLSTKIHNKGELFKERINRLMVAQDTGGAIIGPIRYDIFFGRGSQAEWRAGHQNTPAKVYWLLPKDAATTIDPSHWF
ncbi:MAG: murein transglycosylase [Alphaproteobacteria bacterium]|nr:murein transglycosylase [Alphaproteobacteria bacterium]